MMRAVRRKPGGTWQLDETFVTLRGEPYLLWRAVDEHGAELDILLHLSLCQTEGFMNSLSRLLKSTISIPDFISVSKRSISLPRHVLSRAMEPGGLVIADATGFKVYGEDEWHQEKHDVATRRTCRKLHLAVDVHHQIVACELTMFRVTRPAPFRQSYDATHCGLQHNPDKWL